MSATGGGGGDQLQKKRRTAKNRDEALDGLVADQFTDNLRLLQSKLHDKPQLLTFLLSFIDTGRLEAAYKRHMEKSNLGPQEKLFPPSAKFLKQTPITWCRSFICEANPALAIPDEATEEEAKAMRIDMDIAIPMLCLGLNVSDQVWLFHREQSTARNVALARYNALGKRFAHLRHPINFDLVGFYCKSNDNKRILAAAIMGAGAENALFIESPFGDDVDFTFQHNCSADAVCKSSSGDVLKLLPRFRKKYPQQFAESIVCEVKESIAADGKSPHESLGIVKRKQEARPKRRPQAKAMKRAGISLDVNEYDDGSALPLQDSDEAASGAFKNKGAKPDKAAGRKKLPDGGRVVAGASGKGEILDASQGPQDDESSSEADAAIAPPAA